MPTNRFHHLIAVGLLVTERQRKGMGEMPRNRIQLLGAGLVVTVGLAATSGAASAPATGPRLAADAAQGKSKIAFISRGPQQVHALYVVNADGSGRRNLTRSPASEGWFAWAPGPSKQGRVVMPGRAHHLVAVGIVAMVALGAAAGAAPAPAGGEESSTPPPVARVAGELARSGAQSVMVFVSDAGKEYVATAGARRPAAEQRFRVGSVTKTFTATIVLQLVQEGALRLGSTLDDHLPGVVPRGDEITLRHLLSHRSGLVNITDYPSWLEPALRSPSTRPIDTLRFAGSKPLLFKPGSQGRGSYSNTNYIALGLVIEKVTGRSYAQELEQRILEPLGLDQTELPRTQRLPDLADGGYNPNVPWAAGAIVSNARDLSRFYSALLSGRILSSASLSTMKKTVGGVGLGIFSTALACGRSWGHLGAIIDYVTLVSAREQGDRVAVVSVRGGPPFLPPVEGLLLCQEGEFVAGPAQVDRKLAFISSRGPGPGPLYVVGADGSGQRWLTLTASGIPAWSPDGRRIAFESVRDVINSELFVVNADGSGLRRLTRNYDHDFAPAWSRDGRKIAFLSNHGGNVEIYVMNTAGSRQRNLTRNPAADSAFAWSPDGRSIAFTSKRDGNWDLYVMTADGNGQRRLTRGNPVASAPVWSPDGRKIAFTSKRNGNFEVFVMNADGSAQRNLTRNAGRDLAPAWSPDGRRIAFGSVRNGKPGVYVVNSDGSGHRRLTQHGERPLWSPDGRSIAFRSERDVYVMNADGSGQRNLTRSPATDEQFAWAPGRSK